MLTSASGDLPDRGDADPQRAQQRDHLIPTADSAQRVRDMVQTLRGPAGGSSTSLGETGGPITGAQRTCYRVPTKRSFDPLILDSNGGPGQPWRVLRQLQKGGARRSSPGCERRSPGPAPTSPSSTSSTWPAPSPSSCSSAPGSTQTPSTTSSTAT